jgi:hypothetical protein
MTRFALLMAVALADAPQLVNDVLLPPAEYDRPYRGTLSVIRLDTRAEVTARCGWGAIACAREDRGYCEVIMFRDETRESVLRHEIGHCNGWRHKPLQEILPPAAVCVVAWFCQR